MSAFQFGCVILNYFDNSVFGSFSSKNESIVTVACVHVQSPEGRDAGWRPGQRLAAPRGQERQPGPALLGEAHQESP